MITPFRPDGAVDLASLHVLVEEQLRLGIRMLVPCGTTGEAATLTETEWLQVVETVCQVAAGRVPVFAGCTFNATQMAVHRVQRLSRVPGLTGVLTANPYYNRPGQEGQYQHFRAIAAATDLPVMLYNIPSRTGANLEPATVLQLAEIPNVVGIKESSGNLLQITELLTRAPRTFRVFAGDDTLALPILALGGAGLISVASNAIPAQMVELVDAALTNDWDRARRLNRQFFGLMQAHFWEPSPAPVKAVMAILGKANETMRLPMVPVNRATRARLERLVGELGLLVEAPPTGDDLRMF